MALTDRTKCPHCGKPNRAATTHCVRCGRDLASPPDDERRSRRRRRRWRGLLRLALALGPRVAAFALAYPAATVVIGAGLLPPLVLALAMWWIIDAREREPRRWALRAFTWGIVATFIAGSFNSATTSWLVLSFPNVPPRYLLTVFVAPVAEETLKACSVLFVFLLYPRQFDGVIDGIVYATLTGLGFELTENLFYHLGAFSGGGLARLEEVAFLRVVIFAAGHAMITTFTGVGIGLAASARSTRRKWALGITGFCMAIAMHSLHNLLAGLEEPGHPGLAILSSVGLAWCGNCLWLLVVGLAIRAEARWVREELAAEVQRGTLRPEDAIAAGGLVARIRRSLAVYPPHSHPGRRQRALLWRLDELAARLALTKHRLRYAPEDREFGRLVTVYRARCRRLTHRLYREA